MSSDPAHRVTPRLMIAGAVRRARQQRNLKQAQLARRMASLGYAWHPQTVSQVEQGSRSVSAEEILGLALACEVPATYFIRPYGDLTKPPALDMPDGPLLPSSEASDLTLPIQRKPLWIQWVDDQAHWPTDAQVLAYQEAEAAYDAAQQRTGEAKRECGIAAAAREHALDGGPNDEEIELLERAFSERVAEEQEAWSSLLRLRVEMTTVGEGDRR